MSELEPVLEQLLAEAEAGRPAALCAVVETKGSAPQSPGAGLLIRADRSTVGTIGGGCVEAEVIRRAHKEAMATGEASRMSFVLDHDWGWDDGLICGGKMEIGVMPIGAGFDPAPYRRALEAARRREPATFPLIVRHEGKTLEYRVRLDPPPALAIAGAGHVGQALARIAVDLDFRTTVIDDRAEYASRERFDPRVELVVESIPGALERWKIDPETYVVIVTRGHNNDQRALEAVIGSDAGYIGLIGSQRKRRLIYEDLIKRGVAQEKLDRVHSPIGLPIRATTAAEIAVSIAAELIQHRRRERRGLVEGPIVREGAASA
jgi:xanthine dehydrogenase accessory factor